MLSFLASFFRVLGSALFRFANFISPLPFNKLNEDGLPWVPIANHWKLLGVHNGSVQFEHWTYVSEVQRWQRVLVQCPVREVLSSYAGSETLSPAGAWAFRTGRCMAFDTFDEDGKLYGNVQVVRRILLTESSGLRANCSLQEVRDQASSYHRDTQRFMLNWVRSGWTFKNNVIGEVPATNSWSSETRQIPPSSSASSGSEGVMRPGSSDIPPSIVRRMFG